MTQSALNAGAFARAQSFLTKISKRHEGIWQQVDGVRQLAHEHEIKWNRRCFIPCRLLNNEFQDPFPTRGRYNRPGQLEQSKRLRDIDVIAGMASWRLTKGIFVMSDEDVAAAREVGIPSDPDPKMFLQLPQPCVYVPTPGFSWLGDPLSGFFAYLDDYLYDESGELGLILLMDRDEPVFQSLTDTVHVRIEYQIHKVREPMTSRADIIRNWKKGAEWAMDKDDRNFFQATVLRDYWNRPTLQGESTKHPEQLLEILKSTLEEDILPIAGLLYRLCAVTAEIPPADRPPKPKPKRTPSGFQMIPAQEITAWDVKTRTRQLRKRPTSSEAGAEHRDGNTGQSKRTHTRNAHLRRLSNGKQVQIPSAIVNAAATPPDDRPITAVIVPPLNRS